MIRRIQKRSQYGGQLFSTIAQHDEGAIRKTVDYMLKDDGSGYTKYCPEDAQVYFLMEPGIQTDLILNKKNVTNQIILKVEKNIQKKN